MIKASFNIKSNEQLNKLRLANKQIVLSDDEVQKLLKDNNLDDNAVDNYLSKIVLYLKAKSICPSCKSKADCKFHPIGNIPTLDVHNDEIIVKYVECDVSKRAKLENNDNTNFLYSDIEKNNQDLSLRNIIANASDNLSTSYLNALAEIKKWKHENNRKGLFIFGASGTGKSYLVSAIANDYNREGKTVAYYTASILAQSLRNNYLSYDEIDDILDTMSKADLLVIDGLGTEIVNNNWRDLVLIPILDIRKRDNLKTIITSTLSLEMIKDYYSSTMYREQSNKGEIIKNRISDMMLVIDLNTKR